MEWEGSECVRKRDMKENRGDESEDPGQRAVEQGGFRIGVWYSEGGSRVEPGEGRGVRGDPRLGRGGEDPGFGTRGVLFGEDPKRWWCFWAEGLKSCRSWGG